MITATSRGSFTCTVYIYTCIDIRVSAALKSDPSSSAEQTAAGGYTATTVALAACMGALLALLIVIIIVVVVRRVPAHRRKNIVSFAAVAGGAAERVRHSLPSWGFETLRSKSSDNSDDSVSTQAS